MRVFTEVKSIQETRDSHIIMTKRKVQQVIFFIQVSQGS